MKLKKGTVDSNHLNLLMELTSIRSEPVIKGLHLHLCEGFTQAEAAQKAAVAQSLLSRRVTILNKVNQTVKNLSVYYPNNKAV
ncbi:PapB/FocB family fimbrial expression transcriptional regulator [Paraferrimonas sp. SM1919]|uniref:PapB/FocB family fimbrial expression transcriptional regulator n=1 Tax=Paraferrimonas sp. SM1919 TaxID=2662263 RepID=UPI0013D010CB|nr:PapB/FocB family fimbrial expression transcriptional regulator [Paraferrimonas sp. SM1919]